LDTATNTARFCLAPGAIKYCIFDAAAIFNSRTEQNEQVCYQVSPQFNVSHDDFFETVRPLTGNPSVQSFWQQLTGFQKS
jgi:hypothetical protein